MVGDVPVQIGLVHAVDRDQEHVLDLSMAVRTRQSARRQGDHPDEAKDGYRASYEGATGRNMFHVSLQIQ